MPGARPKKLIWSESSVSVIPLAPLLTEILIVLVGSACFTELLLATHPVKNELKICLAGLAPNGLIGEKGLVLRSQQLL